ncbi:hypothetical protein COO60DRAFT_1112953 [Scenedesmus sp. NREL 46B-D3]|nr:hypothetical protein COO60DRAFT_1112953 [Scenedesmus sp. NREL 46B-D3]
MLHIWLGLSVTRLPPARLSWLFFTQLQRCTSLKVFLQQERYCSGHEMQAGLHVGCTHARSEPSGSYLAHAEHSTILRSNTSILLTNGNNVLLQKSSVPANDVKMICSVRSAGPHSSPLDNQCFKST